MNIRTLLFTVVAALAPLFASAADTTPTVSTNTRYARGATMAFARIDYHANGAIIDQRGICYATHPNPTIEDSITTKTIGNNADITGIVYWLQNLEPSTRYYMRGFAKDRNGNVGYGDVVRFYTLPKGNVGYTLNRCDDDAVNNRLTAAGDLAVYYWNNLTSIQGFHATLNYSPGTPTADCSYGGWVRYGTNTSYQSIHTTLHEWTHGVGVGTHWVWNNNADMRSNTTRGTWLGERATEVVQFLANNTTSVLSGDGTHMWPYQMNYASEDHGETSYICNSLTVQALGEDGLPLTESMGFASPYDAFDCEDTVKYYLKNESPDHGLYSAYLKEQADGTLKWIVMSVEKAKANDSTAWYFKYNPVNCYYTIRNAATGHYIIYSSGFRASNVASTATSAQIQLLRGRVEAVDGMPNHGYFLAFNNHCMSTSSWDNGSRPPVLSASGDRATTAGSFSYSNDAKADRWLILTADEAEQVEKIGMASVGTSLDDLLNKVEAMLAVSHTESVEGTDAALRSEIDAIRAEAATVTDPATVETLRERALAAATAFLPNVSATFGDKPFDITFFLTNPEVTTTEGWTASNDSKPTMNYSCGEYFEKAFDFYQTIYRDFPRGYYSVKVQAFQRPGTTADTYTAWSTKQTTPAITTEIYFGLATASKPAGDKVKNIWDEAQSAKVGTGTEASQGSLYVPNDMHAASAYFDKGLYDNTRQGRQAIKVSAANGFKVGIRCTSASSSYWTIFRNFRLYYHGSQVATGVENVNAEAAKAVGQNVYNINGQLVRSNANSLSGLPAGLYIVGGKKVIVK